jgi:hypothetical protein
MVAVLPLLALAGLLAVAFGSGAPEPHGRPLSGGVWLASDRAGQLTLLDSASAGVTAQLQVAKPGSGLDVVQDGSSAFSIDRSTGSIRRVDGATLQVTEPVVPIPGAGAGLRAFAGAGALYAVDSDHGVLASVDPVTLANRAGPLPLPTGPAAALDGAGRLWLLDAGTGDLTWLDNGDKHVRQAASSPGAGLLAIADGTPVLVDAHRNTAEVLDPLTGESRHTTALDLRPGDEVRVSGSPRAPRLYLVTARGTVTSCDLTSAGCASAVPLPGDGARPGPAVEAGDRLFVPDSRSGKVWIVDPGTSHVLAVPQVLTAPGAGFQLLAHDGVVFFNDPDSERAGVVRPDGGVQHVRKYDPDGSPWGRNFPSRNPPTSGPPALPPLSVRVSNSRPLIGQDVTLDVSTEGGPPLTNVHWVFGDGSEIDGVHTTHSWWAARTFQVSATGTFADGRTGTALVAVQVLAQPQPQAMLTVQVTGPAGGGKVTGGGLSCPPTCTITVQRGLWVTLAQTPGPYYAFAGWGGACTSVFGCAVIVDSDKTVTAAFRDTAAPEDCTSYDPTTVRVVDAGNGEWRLESGSTTVFTLADQQSAQEGLAIAKRHNQLCRASGREYWKGGSGGTDSAPSATCLSYDPATLTVIDDGLRSGSVSLVRTQDRPLAVRLLRVAAQYRRLCTLGGPDGLDYWQ